MRRRKPETLDWTIVAVLSVATVGARLVTLDRAGFWALPIELAACVALKWRRTRPLAVLAFIAAAFTFEVATLVPENNVGIPMMIAIYSAFGYAPRRQAIIGFVATLIALNLASFAPWVEPHRERIIEGLVMAVFGAVGDNRRVRRAYVAGIEERAARLEREREVQAKMAAAEERARIARELHDVVAHSLSVMVAQADGAAYVVDNSPADARQAIETVAETGRSALSEMHRLLGILRSDDEDTMAPQPGVDQLDALIARTQSAGLPVTLTVQGAPAELSPGLSLTVYRIVQEALTNTLKHAGPAVSARVQLRYDDEAVEIDVDDDGSPARAAPGLVDDEGGHGLTGMRERTAVYGGSLQAGPRAGRGWRIHARLPLEAGS